MKKLIFAIAALQISFVAIAQDDFQVNTRSDLDKGVLINCKGESISTVQRKNGQSNEIENESLDSALLTDGNSNLVIGKVVLKPTAAEKRRIDVEVSADYAGNNSDGKALTIKVSTDVGGHTIIAYGKSIATLNIDKAAYTCRIDAVAGQVVSIP